MNRIIDRLVVLIVGIACVWFAEYPEYNRIIVILAMIIYAGFSYYLSENRNAYLVNGLMSGLILINDGFLPCIFLLIYDTVYDMMLGSKHSVFYVLTSA